MFLCLALFSITLLADNAILTPEQAVAIALEENPSLAQINARAEAMSAIPSQERTLPEPIPDFRALNLPTAYGLNSVAAESGVIMLIYLDQALEKY